MTLKINSVQRVLTVARLAFLFFWVVLLSSQISAGVIKGKVFDLGTKEVLPAATIYIEKINKFAISDAQGNFQLTGIPDGEHIIQVKYLGYDDTFKQVVKLTQFDAVLHLDLGLRALPTTMKEVTISSLKSLETDVSARMTERISPNMVNVVSAKSIELSPDLDVASVVQRVSGVTLDKSSSGSGQYAILRGMDKRYSYTLVNDIKIPSTDDKHRYISLDIFPADMEDRIEVSKALTPDMEGDAMAGVINLVMKNAPRNLLVKANASVGYNSLFIDNNFMTYNTAGVNHKSPYELNGISYYATSADFSKSNLDQHTVSLPSNIISGFTIGDRFFKKRLGWIFSASYNNSYRMTKSLYFAESQSTTGNNLPVLTSMVNRTDNNEQTNYGLHNKLDYEINQNHSISAYIVYMDFKIKQARAFETTELGNNSYDPEHGSKNVTQSIRNMLNLQKLVNTTLQGNHNFGEHFSVKWSGVYSKATNQTPDMATITYDQTYINGGLQPQYVDFGGSNRLWLHNTDEDKAGYLNLKYKANTLGGNLEVSTGGLIRDKLRRSFYNNYVLMPQGPVDAHSAKDIDWVNYSDINWNVVNPLGAVNTAGTFNAYERVFAGFIMINHKINKLTLIGGFRSENSNQGYDEVFHNAFLDQFVPNNNQKRDHFYHYLLPSFNFTYDINARSNFKGAYYKAINKPGFLEIVPYLDNTGDYPKTGNPDLRNAVADNYDVRYAFFPNKINQVLAGVFYKKIIDAIEDGFNVDGHGNYTLSPMNSNAINYGFEIDYTKFFNQIGVKANYTWTHSETSSNKRSQVNGVLNRDSTVSSSQSRPLYGQAQHIGNLSIIYKGIKNKVSAQLALTYTGERIYKVSPDINGDLWQKPIWQVDFSAEKRLKKGFSVFFKARNLLNAHIIVFLKQKNSANEKFPEYNTLSGNTTLIRNEYTGSIVMAGVRFRFEK